MYLYVILQLSVIEGCFAGCNSSLTDVEMLTSYLNCFLSLRAVFLDSSVVRSK